MSSAPMIAPDAAMVLGIASTAMPFARTPEAEAERWLRLLRLHGDAGIALQALGVSETTLPATDEVRAHAGDAPSDAGDPPPQLDRATGVGGDRDAVTRVTERTVRIAEQRAASAVETTDVLVAVLEVYGEDFDRVLRAHGTNRDEVLERLGAQMSASG